MSAVNVYTVQVEALCPVDRSRDVYRATLTAGRMLMAEALREYAETLIDREIFQEDLTAEIALKFGCSVELDGRHKGVRIVSRVTEDG